MHTKIFVTLLILMFNTINVDSAKKLENHAETIEQCETPKDKFDQNNKLKYSFALSGKPKSKDKDFSGFIYVDEKTLPVSYSLRWFRIVEGKKYEMFRMINMLCRSPVIAMIIKVVKINTDEECSIEPGNYTVSNLNTAQYKNSNFLTIPPGRYKIDFEMGTNKGVIMCSAVVINVVKL